MLEFILEFLRYTGLMGFIVLLGGLMTLIGIIVEITSRLFPHMYESEKMRRIYSLVIGHDFYE